MCTIIYNYNREKKSFKIFMLNLSWQNCALHAVSNGPANDTGMNVELFEGVRYFSSIAGTATTTNMLYKIIKSDIMTMMVFTLCLWRHALRETQKTINSFKAEFCLQCLHFVICYVLSTLKVQLTVELVKCTLLLNRLLVLQIYCCVVGVNIIVTEHGLSVSPEDSNWILNCWLH